MLLFARGTPSLFRPVGANGELTRRQPAVLRQCVLLLECRAPLATGNRVPVCAAHECAFVHKCGRFRAVGARATRIRRRSICASRSASILRMPLCSPGRLLVSDQSEALGARDCLGSLVDLQLEEDALHVRFDGLGCYAERARNLLIRLALGNQLENVAFARTERLLYTGCVSPRFGLVQ